MCRGGMGLVLDVCLTCLKYRMFAELSGSDSSEVWRGETHDNDMKKERCDETDKEEEEDKR